MYPRDLLNEFLASKKLRAPQNWKFSDWKCITVSFSFYCIVKKECRPETCKNGGTCTEIAVGRHLCTCPVGFLGDDCEGG